MSLRLESDTAVRLYYTGEKIDGITVRSGRKEAGFTEGTANGMHYIKIPDIAAQCLDDPYTVSFGGKGNVTINALSYASLILNAYDGNEAKADICSTVKALYQYNRAAQTYFDALNG